MSGVVLMYHRVARPTVDPFDLAVNPARFAAHVNYLGGLGSVVPLPEVLQPSKATTVAITFDDGYADNAITAAPLLINAGLPATYFITSGTLGAQRFWWDRLATAFLSSSRLPSGIDVRVGERSVWLALNDPDARATSLRFLHRRLRPLAPEALGQSVSEVLVALGTPDSAEDNLTMTVEQLRTVANEPLIDIGAHTRTHLQLAGQPESTQRYEIAGSCSDLHALLGKPITSFAYPFGTQRAVGDLAPALAREAGCIVACSTDRRRVDPTNSPHRIPRLAVGDWTVARLHAEIKQLAAVG